VDNEQELMNWILKVETKGLKWAEFREPDIGNQMTAIACLTDTNVFSKLKLY
jgi:hypothetical protein